MRFAFSLLFLFPLLSIGQSIKSPDGNLHVEFRLNDVGVPLYQLNYKGMEVIRESKLGLQLRDREIGKAMSISSAVERTVDYTWKPVLGEYSEIRDHFNELLLELVGPDGLKLNITFRLYNDGLAFRYELPEQAPFRYFELHDELTEFNLTGDHKAFWIPGDYDSQEYAHNESKLSEIDNAKIDLNNGIGLKTIPGRYLVQSPLMMKTNKGLYLNIFEAALDNFPVMHLQLDRQGDQFKFISHLVPNAVGSKAFLRTPFQSPWRTIITNEDARKIISANRMILNLNEPCKIEDTSWIKPMKYVGVWWEMHVGVSTWDYAGTQDAITPGEEANVRPTGKHGATTENTKRYIDFAARHGFDGVLVEGWNIGWEDWYGNWKEDVFDFITPYPDFDLAEVHRYASQKNVKMIMHHETSGSVSNYERWLDRAMDLMLKYNYPAVKSGYVGKIIPRGEYHDGQAMINHFNYVARRMAENKLMVNSHESSRPTGIHRTWPNYIAAEAARGNEFNAWSNGNPPDHETILPFTRLMGGPMDYTPGIFEIKMSVYTPGSDKQVHTTLAKQLALYVTLYSPLQMAADLPQNYEKYPDAFKFIKDVALDWDDTRILEAEPGDYLTIARKTKGKDEWFLGAITDENSRTTEISLDFLSPGKKYSATIYADGPGADWKNNPMVYQIRTVNVNSKSKLKLVLAKGGGTAIHFALQN
jgi:glucan 1,4-alpha-glucosidase